MSYYSLITYGTQWLYDVSPLLALLAVLHVAVAVSLFWVWDRGERSLED